MKIKKKLTTEEQVLQFIGRIQRLQPIEFMGLAKILCVPVYNKVEGGTAPEVRPFEDIFADMFDRYVELRPKTQKEIDKLLKEIEKENGKSKTSTHHKKHKTQGN